LLRTAIVAATLFVAASSARAQDPAPGEKAFRICRGCHQIGPNAMNAIGPELNGIVGRKAGTYPGYLYSAAIKQSGIVWTPEELGKYLTSPQTAVPHNQMRDRDGVKDERTRKDVIDYMEQFGPDGEKKQ
jgi:cytochrome c